MNHQNILSESTVKSCKPPSNSSTAWKVNLFFVYWKLHNLNVIQQVSPPPPPPPCTKPVATTVTCSKRDEFILNWMKGTICFEKGNLFHVIVSILRQFRAFVAYQRFIKICNKKLRITTWVLAFPFTSITLLYYLFLNSMYISSNKKFKVKTSTKLSFRIVSTVIFTHVNIWNNIKLNWGEKQYLSSQSCMQHMQLWN